MRTAVVLLAVLPAAGAQSDPFDGRLQPVAPEPVAIVAADVDGDGLTDLVTSNDAGNSISVLLADGTGTFAPAVDQAASPEPNGILAEDLNGDGSLDLVLCHSRIDRVAIGLNDGKGVFGPWTLLPVGDDPRTVAAGDLDADGNLDLVTANFAAATASVLLGNGAGGFAPATSHPAAAGTFGVAVGDLDHDGFADVVTANNDWPSTITVMLSDGAGSFSSVTSLQADVAAHWGAQSVTIADLNADGDADAVVAINILVGPGLTTLFLGDGSGGFGPPLHVGLDLGSQRAVLDLDGDGRLDVLGTTGSTTGSQWGNPQPELRVVLGDGLGGFSPPTPWATGLGPLGMAVGDFDQDQRPDVAVAARDAQAVALHFGDGAGGFRAPPAQPLVSSPNAAIVIAKLDGGGAADVVSTLSDGYAVLLGDGEGGLGPPAVTTVLSCFSTSGLAVGELNGDGVPDLAVSFVTGCQVLRAAFGDGLGGFPTYASIGGKTGDVVIADLNGDTINDVIDGEGDFLLVRLGTGGGHFMLAQSLPTCTVGALEVEDFTGDGVLDAVTLCLVPQQLLTLMPGDGTGVFTGSIAVDADTALQWLTSGDVDEDGLPDIVLAEKNTLTVLLSLGGGSFAPAQHFALHAFSGTAPAPPNLSGLVLADVDGDLHLDAITANGNASTISVLLGNGGGGFAFAGAFLTTGALQGLACGDLDGDGFPDVVVGSASPSTAELGVLLNRTTGPWTDVGAGLAGTGGLPTLSAEGSLQPSSPISIAISNGPAFGTATLIIGGSALDVPFKGGTLVPFPNLLLFGLPLNASGGFAASGTWFGQLPSGTATWFQAWMHDPGGPAGWSATNALLGVVP